MVVSAKNDAREQAAAAQLPSEQDLPFLVSRFHSPPAFPFLKARSREHSKWFEIRNILIAAHLYLSHISLAGYFTSLICLTCQVSLKILSPLGSFRALSLFHLSISAILFVYPFALISCPYLLACGSPVATPPSRPRPSVLNTRAQFFRGCHSPPFLALRFPIFTSFIAQELFFFIRVTPVLSSCFSIDFQYRQPFFS